MINYSPTDSQIQNAGFMGWDYLGDGLFAKGDVMGWYSIKGGWETDD